MLTSCKYLLGVLKSQSSKVVLLDYTFFGEELASYSNRGEQVN